MSQEPGTTLVDLAVILEREGLTCESGAGGRHRAQSRLTERAGLVTGAAVAAGALLVTGYQVGNPAAADADEAVTDPGGIVNPVAGPIPGLENLPPELQAGAQQFADFAQNFGKAPEPVAPAVPSADPVALPGLPDLPPEIEAGIQQLNQLGADIARQLTPQAPVVRPVSGQISSGYGARWGSMHYGLDFADAIGAPIHAVSTGTVIEAGPASGFGLWVRVRHDDGTVSVYGHVNDILSHVGQRVNAGDTIATVGNRGWSTGPHLHLEIWEPNGAKVDPAQWLIARGVPLGWGAANA